MSECDDLRPRPILEKLDPSDEEELTYLWDPYIPEQFFFGVAGEEGTSKTLWLIDLISRITNGTEMPNGTPTEEGGVLLMITEDHLKRMLIPRMNAAGVNFDRVRLLRWGEEAGKRSTIELPRDFGLVAQAAEELQQQTGLPCRLVHLEPLVDRLEAEINENSYKQVRQALMHVSPLAERLRCTFGATSHWNKQTSFSRKHRLQGSTAFLSAFRVGFSIYVHPEDADIRVFHLENSRLVPASMVPPLAFKVVGPVGRPRLEWLGEADLPEEEGQPQRRGDDRSACADWLRTRLADGVCVARAVLVTDAAAKGWSESTLRRAADDIGVEVQPIPGGDHNRVLWSLICKDELTN